jgi:hypothetical protein
MLAATRGSATAAVAIADAVQSAVSIVETTVIADVTQDMQL